ncbi:MAG: NUDIX domain-containing protein, partial [Acutalibacteraceae bacterium]|nr:NUDIX domain-containing protein [Acutalibacteraceae bacterium]
ALSGEGSRHAAIRELNEELGIRPPRREMVHIRRMLRKYSLNDIWAVKCNCDIEDLRLQKEEVDCVKWVTQMELKGMIECGLFHNYGRSYFETVFSIPQKLISRGK